MVRKTGFDDDGRAVREVPIWQHQGVRCGLTPTLGRPDLLRERRPATIASNRDRFGNTAGTLGRALAAALGAGGRPFPQTWAGERYGGRGSASSGYRLRPGELPSLFPTLFVRHCRGDWPPDSGFHDQAQLIAESPAG